MLVRCTLPGTMALAAGVTAGSGVGDVAASGSSTRGVMAAAGAGATVPRDEDEEQRETAARAAVGPGHGLILLPRPRHTARHGERSGDAVPRSVATARACCARSRHASGGPPPRRPADREAYRRDETPYLARGCRSPSRSPTETAEVVELVRLAAEFDVPIVPRGAGTGLSGAPPASRAR